MTAGSGKGAHPAGPRSPRQIPSRCRDFRLPVLRAHRLGSSCPWAVPRQPQSRQSMHQQALHLLRRPRAAFPRGPHERHHRSSGWTAPLPTSRCCSPRSYRWLRLPELYSTLSPLGFPVARPWDWTAHRSHLAWIRRVGPESQPPGAESMIPPKRRCGLRQSCLRRY